MGETWVIPEKFIHSSGGTEGHFLIPAASPWFSGHFPDMPILPAIGMLGMVYDTLAEYASHNGVRLTLAGMKRVRFRQVLGPGAHFTVSLSPGTLPDASPDASQKESIVPFHCTSGDTKICDGALLISRATF